MSFTSEQAANGATVIRVDGQLIVANRQELKQLVTACNAANLQATLIYHAPTSAVIVSAVPASATRKESLQAAGLASAPVVDPCA